MGDKRVEGSKPLLNLREFGLQRVRERQVSVKERLNSPDVFPVAVKQVGLHLEPQVIGTGDNLAAEVVGLRVNSCRA